MMQENKEQLRLPALGEDEAALPLLGNPFALFEENRGNPIACVRVFVSVYFIVG